MKPVRSIFKHMVYFGIYAWCHSGLQYIYSGVKKYLPYCLFFFFLIHHISMIRNAPATPHAVEAIQKKWPEIPPHQCERLIPNDHKRLISVIGAKSAQHIIRFTWKLLFHIGLDFKFFLWLNKLNWHLGSAFCIVFGCQCVIKIGLKNWNLCVW